MEASDALRLTGEANALFDSLLASFDVPSVADSHQVETLVAGEEVDAGFPQDEGDVEGVAVEGEEPHAGREGRFKSLGGYIVAVELNCSGDFGSEADHRDAVIPGGFDVEVDVAGVGHGCCELGSFLGPITV